MNNHYCSETARGVIEACFARASQDDDNIPPLLGNVQTDGYCVTEFDNPKSFRITKVEDQEQEAYFRVVGVICSKVLPPVLHKPRLLSPAHLRNLRQFVKLTGFGSDSFAMGCHAVKQMVDKLRQHLKVASDCITGAEEKMYEGDAALDFHARYFTDRELIPHEKHIPFNDFVDPNHILEDLRGAAFIQGPDNHVEYCMRTVDKNGIVEYSVFNPGQFKEGDIVEVTLSLVCVPIKNQQYRLLLVMRALTLLSSENREESERLRALDVPSSDAAANRGRNVKRRSLFLDCGRSDVKVRKTMGDMEAMDT
ncbi:hypothetical protein CC1G_09679 [Coprinopsis cinerea okayama7|uniref:Uncharacterized protein n=1 Tax=Coprinopsis cinerea (strain Okayama-7 / 130 / ATCC MYA-4618 / FGSC 9003) TaxID=240176 RepID=A8P9H9_COPC7|nr:hypothetical protein CC1G_09679 [Coprinopsis cinerea okayama7\|eukprot:XP_001839776.1 hypothetical protein CC1G_09679 [Coprinopsis cinerea okayama7\